MRMTCPECGAQAHVSAFFVEDDGKRLAGLFAEMEPVLGRAVLGYLGLFKPGRQALRLSRAVKLTQGLLALVNTGTVCRDERGGVRRAASPGVWAQGIEAMLTRRATQLPARGGVWAGRQGRCGGGAAAGGRRAGRAGNEIADATDVD